VLIEQLGFARSAIRESCAPPILSQRVFFPSYGHGTTVCTRKQSFAPLTQKLPFPAVIFTGQLKTRNAQGTSFEPYPTPIVMKRSVEIPGPWKSTLHVRRPQHVPSTGETPKPGTSLAGVVTHRWVGKSARVELLEGRRIEPGHDAWVVGDKPFISIDFGDALYAKQQS
jgi:hypothetical protein